MTLNETILRNLFTRIKRDAIVMRGKDEEPSRSAVVLSHVEAVAVAELIEFHLANPDVKDRIAKLDTIVGKATFPEQA